jgi:hypothetical protein
VRNSVGLPGSGPSNHQQWSSRHARAMPDTVFDGPTLFRVQLIEIGHGQPGRRDGTSTDLSAIPILFATPFGLRPSQTWAACRASIKAVDRAERCKAGSPKSGRPTGLFAPRFETVSGGRRHSQAWGPTAIGPGGGFRVGRRESGMISVAAACQSLFPPQRSGRSRCNEQVNFSRFALIPHAVRNSAGS